MKKHRFLSFLLAASLMNSCDSKIDELESQRPSSNVATTEKDGVVTATIDPNATVDQILVASPTSKAADASVTFPPGALAVATDISIGEAIDQSSALLSELGVNGLVQGGAPVYIGPASAGTTVDVAQPLTIQLPIPLEDLSLTGLADDDSKLVLIYVIHNNGWKSGIIPLTKENLVGAFLKVALKGLGYFQVAYLATAATTKEATSSIRPALGTNEDDGESPKEPGSGTGGMGDYKGFYAGTVTEVSNVEANGAAGNGMYCAIASNNFKMWLSPYTILLYKVSTPAPESKSSEFDGDLSSFGDIAAEDPTSFTVTYSIQPSSLSIENTGMKNTGVKYTAGDYQAQKTLKLTLEGGFSGTSTRKYQGTLTVSMGESKVCEYTLDLTQQ
jgi:hypothetical protein